MDFVTESKKDNILKNDALGIAKIAREDKGGINATLGIFSPLEPFSFLEGVSSKLQIKQKYGYSSVDGGEEFRKAVNAYLGLDGCYVVATPGGTGAINASINLTLEKGEDLLIPYPCWGPYNNMAKGLSLNAIYYNLIKDDKFDLSDFIKKANEIIDRQRRLVFIINDPCQNPTGYSLSNDELKELFNYLNNLSVPVSVIYDLAYLDISNEKRHIDRSFLDIKVNDNVNILYCVSFSKSYQIYGQRLGALATKNEEFYKVACFYARTTWSNCNNAMINVVSEVELNKEIKKEHIEGLEKIRSELIKRSKIFLDEAKECDLNTIKYNGGFFISIPCSNNKEVYEKLKAEHIHILPVCNIVRVAICGLECDKLKGLAKKIKKYIKA